MASSRITISLHPERLSLLRAFAAAQGVSVSRVLDELLESIEPSLTRALALVQAASSAPDSVRQQLASSMASIESALVASSNLSLSHVEALSSLFEAARSIETGPRIVTRGSHATGTNQINGLASAGNSRSYRRRKVKHV